MYVICVRSCSIRLIRNGSHNTVTGVVILFSDGTFNIVNSVGYINDNHHRLYFKLFLFVLSYSDRWSGKINFAARESGKVNDVQLNQFLRITTAGNKARFRFS